ncbi:hypothetical protein [Melioribacter sp. OK-6-Me]|uniref:hypothetical protein n=1 Tax=unclassified Melioribacter TaxID=2627329 RepID=UPI003EDB2187
MKRLLYLCLFLLISCSESSDIVAPVLYNVEKSSTATIKLGIKNYAYINNELKILFLEVPSDSRCPIGVECFWEGNAVVRLRIVLGSEKRTVDLNTFRSFGYSYSIGNYLIRLKSLSPYPVYPDSINPEEYVVELEILNSPNPIQIESIKELELYKKDPYVINKMELLDDKLILQVSYSGGCRKHEFYTLWYYPPWSSVSDVNLYLMHDNNGDMCEAYLSDTVFIDLGPIKQYFQSMNIDGVALHVHNNLELYDSIRYNF